MGCRVLIGASSRVVALHTARPSSKRAICLFIALRRLVLDEITRNKATVDFGGHWWHAFGIAIFLRANEAVWLIPLLFGSLIAMWIRASRPVRASLKMPIASAVVGFLLPLILMGFVHEHIYGSPFASGYNRASDPIPGLAVDVSYYSQDSMAHACANCSVPVWCSRTEYTAKRLEVSCHLLLALDAPFSLWCRLAFYGEKSWSEKPQTYFLDWGYCGDVSACRIRFVGVS